MNERLEKQIAFLLEADKIKNVFRRTYNADQQRKENSAEHSWHLALLALILAEHSDIEIDRFRVMSMVVIHDIIEIDAGDTYAYDTVALESQKDREERAAERIYGLLPDDQRDELRALFEEFEAGESAEARFAKTMDNFQPLLLNDSNSGADWREHKVTKSKVVGRQRKSIIGSKEIWEYTSELIDENVKKGNIIDE